MLDYSVLQPGWVALLEDELKRAKLEILAHQWYEHFGKFLTKGITNKMFV